MDWVGEEKNKECESVQLPTSSSGSREWVLKENSAYAALCVLLFGFLFAKMLPAKCVHWNVSVEGGKSHFSLLSLLWVTSKTTGTWCRLFIEIWNKPSVASVFSDLFSLGCLMTRKEVMRRWLGAAEDLEGQPEGCEDGLEWCGRAQSLQGGCEGAQWGSGCEGIQQEHWSTGKSPWLARVSEKVQLFSLPCVSCNFFWFLLPKSHSLSLQGWPESCFGSQRWVW